MSHSPAHPPACPPNPLPPSGFEPGIDSRREHLRGGSSLATPRRVSALPRPWQPGDELRVRGARWATAAVRRHPDCEELRLEPADRRTARAPCTLLAPFDRPRPAASRARTDVVRPRRWQHCVRRIGLCEHPAGGLRAAAGSTIDLHPYQLEPALAMLRHGAARVLIADAVGLGKTIQAALVIADLAGSADFRGLVITAAGLLEQWSAELAARFGLQGTVADAAWLASAGWDLPPGANPWMAPGLYIASFDFLKRPEVLRPLEDARWDIVVVDEAHAASRGTARRAAAHAAAVRALRVMLLTATPHAGDPDQFEALCRLGAAGSGSRLTIFQRSRDALAPRPRRRSVLLPVRPTPAEERMHRLLDAYAKRLWREAGGREDVRAALAAVILKKRALSSAASLADTARRRLALPGGGPPAAGPVQSALPLDPDEAHAPDEVPDEILAAGGLSDRGRDRRWVAAIEACAREGSRAESKSRCLLRLLRRLRGEPAIVFTEFRDTLERLRDAVAAAGHHVLLLHGGMSRDERASACDAFRRGGAILLATDAASEGLNLQRGCRLVVHYELPWSPARLEQRAGRVDRIGQARRVHEIMLVADDTAERLVLAPLVRRAARGRAAAPFLARLADVLGESRIAAAVMEGVLPAEGGEPESRQPPGDAAVEDGRLRAEAEAEALRLERHRSWLPSRTGRGRAPGLAATLVRLRRSTLDSGLVCVCVVTLGAADGTVVERRVACLHVPPRAVQRFGPGGLRTAPGIRRAVNAFLAAGDRAVRAAAAAAAAGPLEAAAAVHLQAVERLERRARAVAAELPSAARRLVQPGLFDMRAIHADEARRRADGALADASAAVLLRLQEARRLSVTTRLEAILILSRRAG